MITKETCEMCREYDGEHTCTGKQEPHVCPYSEEISGDLTLCDCCEEREDECCLHI
jgi:hypothetical protein